MSREPLRIMVLEPSAALYETCPSQSATSASWYTSSLGDLSTNLHLNELLQAAAPPKATCDELIGTAHSAYEDSTVLFLYV